MILITGASGFIGRHLVKHLLADGHSVRCLLTSRKQRQFPYRDRVQVVTGHILDEEALFRAVTGAHVVIHLENAQWWGRPRDLERIELEGTRNLITAARAARVGRIITVSHLGAAPSAAYPLMRYKGIVEEAIRNSGLAYTIIRSGLVFGDDDAFINNLAMQLRASPVIFFMPGHGEVVVHPIFVDDLVEALVRSLEIIDTVDLTAEIGGPEYMTFEDLVRTVMRVTGARRIIVPVPPYLLRWLLAIYSRVVPRSLLTAQWLDILATNRTAHLSNIFEHFEIRPQRFEDTLLTYMRGRRYFWAMLRYTFRRRPRAI
jgi:NADH dehydrogenase